MYNDLFYKILDGTSCQRLAIITIFIDNPGKAFTRTELFEICSKSPYIEIWEKKSLFPKKDSDNNIPTIFRDRLVELDKNLELLRNEKQGKNIIYFLRRNVSEEHDLFNLKKKSPENISELLTWQHIFEKLKGIPIFSELKLIREDLLSDHVKTIKKQKGFRAVDLTAPHVDTKTAAYLQELYYSIIDESVIDVIFDTYFPSKNLPKKNKLKGFLPYILKQTFNQWYVLGKVHGSTDFQYIPVNRIRKLEENVDLKHSREDFDYDNFWNTSAGITKNGDPIKVSFKLKNGPVYNNIDYLKSNPIIPSQKIKLINQTEADVLLDKIHIGPELIRILRSFGRSNVSEINPKWLEEDLWELNKKHDLEFSVKLLKESTIHKFEKFSQEKLRMEKGGENESSTIKISPIKNKPEWYKVEIKNIPVNSIWFYYYQELKKPIFKTNGLKFPE
jgi:hypothetical protein